MTFPTPDSEHPLPVFEQGTLGERTSWVRARGVEILLPESDKVVTPYMKSRRDWDGTLLDALLDAMTPNSTFIDVGAMIAYVSAVVARTYPTATVVAVEPAPANLEIASRNLAHYSNTVLLAGAVAGSGGLEASMLVDESNRGNSRVEIGVDGGVLTCTLQDLVDAYGATVIKVDVQGMERAVLESLDLDQSHGRDLTIFCEVSPAEWDSSDEIDTLVDDFVSEGFRAYFVTESRAYAPYTRSRLDRWMETTSQWSDHFELLLTQGEYSRRISEGR